MWCLCCDLCTFEVKVVKTNKKNKWFINYCSNKLLCLENPFEFIWSRVWVHVQHKNLRRDILFQIWIKFSKFKTRFEISNIFKQIFKRWKCWAWETFTVVETTLLSRYKNFPFTNGRIEKNNLQLESQATYGTWAYFSMQFYTLMMIISISNFNYKL